MKKGGYELNFWGKEIAIRDYESEIKKSLKVEFNQSKNFDSTGNMIFRGDNLDVLKILKNYYMNKIKMIYIDPPYNTKKKNFLYSDSFKDKEEEIRKELNLEKKQMNKFYHNGWLCFMYPRLKLARDLLRDDGVIFISIDDNEQANLKLLCDEVFGEENFVGCLFVLDNLKGKENDNFISEIGHKILVYIKIKYCLKNIGFNKIENFLNKKNEDKFNFTDEIGYYYKIPFRKSGQDKDRDKRPFMYYPILVKNGCLFSITNEEFGLIFNKKTREFNDNYIELLKQRYEKEGFKFVLPLDKNNVKVRWTSNFNTFNKLLLNNNIFYDNSIKQKVRPTFRELLNTSVLSRAKSIFYRPEYSNATNELNALFSNIKIFNNPKSILLIKDLLNLTNNKNDIILDFFAGSGTTAQAVMELNKEDGGNRKFILVQLDEEISKDKPSATAYDFIIENNLMNKRRDNDKKPYISDITIERCNRAGEKILKELDNKSEIDVGYKVFSLVDKNFLKENYDL